MAGNNTKASFGDFTWFTGVVEDINDPLKAGRVKVRIYFYHEQDKNVIPTEQLPWAMTGLPVTGASTDGIGNTPHALIVGSHVIGFFVDGPNAQLPMVLFSFPGMSDGVPDVNRLARGEVLEKTLEDSGQWKEKASGAKPEYPNNKVIQTTSGHFIEIDDTPGKERLHILHKSGTFWEMHPDGTSVYHTKGENYQIVHKDMKIYVKGNVDMVVNGNVTETIKGNKTSNITGNYNITCKAYSITTKASWTAKVGSTGYFKCGSTFVQKGAKIFLN